MSPLHLLGEYESTTQQHQEQLAPALTQLQASVNQTLHQLQQQERSLVEAQAQQLVQLYAQLATDARCLQLDRTTNLYCSSAGNTSPHPMEIWTTPTLSEKLPVLQISQNRILEIHISDNDGYWDAHTTIGDRTW